MLLAIDAGNTNIVFALFDGDQLRHSWRIHTSRERTEDQYAVFLKECLTLAGLSFSALSAVIIGSVVPEAHRALQLLSEKYISCAPIFVSADNAGIPIALEAPQEVGADRVLNALAAKTFYQSPAIIVDFGTATTFDVVGKSGSYEGGVIAPGINLSLQALHEAASKLPLIRVARPEKVLGKSTIAAMKSGAYWGYVGLIEGIISRLQREIDGPAYVIATGGLATIFAQDLPCIQKIDEDLTMKGLQLVFTAMQSK